MDHGLRAAPHGFSQLATSFLACPRLGILRAPLLRLTRVHYPPLQSTSSTSPILRSLIVMTARRQSLSFPHPTCQKAVGARCFLQLAPSYVVYRNIAVPSTACHTSTSGLFSVHPAGLSGPRIYHPTRGCQPLEKQ
jgi:hypothetical protein